MTPIKTATIDKNILINHLDNLIDKLKSDKIEIYELTDDKCKTPTIYGDNLEKRELNIVYKIY